MSIRDQIMSSVGDETASFKSETVDVPEWGDVKIVIRELSAGDKRLFYARARRFEEVPGSKWMVIPNDDPLADLYLLYLSAFEIDGTTRVFHESDIDELAKGGAATDKAVERLVEIARRVSNLNPEDAEREAGKDSPTPTGKPPSTSASD